MLELEMIRAFPLVYEMALAFNVVLEVEVGIADAVTEVRILRDRMIVCGV